jgi:hypothetical protein
VAGSEAVADTTIVYGSALFLSSVSMMRARLNGLANVLVS